MPPPRLPTAPRLLVLTAQVAVANLAIAGLISMVGGAPFASGVVYSECIGLSIWVVIECGRRLLTRGASGWPVGWRSAALVAVGCTLGYVIGFTLADAIFGCASWRDYLRQPRHPLEPSAPPWRSAPWWPAGSTCAARPATTGRSEPPPSTRPRSRGSACCSRSSSRTCCSTPWPTCAR